MRFSLDSTGQMCPMPLLNLKLLLKNCKTGDTIEQSITDKTSLKDIPAWLENKGHQVEIIEKSDGTYLIKSLIL
ncbi:sulfurtransferase TusA family protein [Catenovulum maritimum]|uniref:UPF0033 domain-containing protein n=1 Tax=Catenovulum maritimum TaxID=1513271 RepID=A0A0J8GZ92_9ALTE|nr:sulfurtransferase TusA family protein [Catenovulum maritimum]KMT66549.1 hypothetical protein XM47_03165 [Catenovulum maritimum]